MAHPKNPKNNTEPKRRNSSFRKWAIAGWATAFLVICGFAWILAKNSESHEDALKSNSSWQENRTLKGIPKEDQQILEIIGSKEFQTITLLGNQAVAPEAFSKIYYNKKKKLAYIDISGLPDPPKEKAFQLWSLQMEPFSANSLGLVESYEKIGEKLYEFPNFTKHGTLCITLEPKQGSNTPTMSRIYVLEMISEN